MNTPSPLIPQGTMPVKGKSTFLFKVLMIFAVHVVLIGGMLLQGCSDTKKDTSSTASPDATTPTADTLPPVTTTSNLNTAVNPPQVPPSNTAPIAQATAAPVPPPVPVAVAPVPPVTQTVAPAPSTDAREYVIVSGDTLGAIAHKNGISLKALMDANAAVNPRKLQIGQKIQIPAGTGATASTASAATPDVASGTGDATVYKVKSGDTLSKIAKLNHTTVKKIMALNDLKTTSIKVDQKLKLPAPKTAEAEATATPVAPTAAAPIVPLQTAPATTTTAAAPTTTSSN